MSIFSIRTFQSLEQVNLYSPEIVPKSFGLDASTNTVFLTATCRIWSCYTSPQLESRSVSHWITSLCCFFVCLWPVSSSSSCCTAKVRFSADNCSVTSQDVYVCMFVLLWDDGKVWRFTEDWDLERHWSRYSVGQHFAKSVVSTHVLQVHWVRL